MIQSLIFISIGYLIGAIPTGWLVAKCAGIEDIRRHGSGNIGATNVARIMGIRFFFLVLVLDLFKAYAYLNWLQQIEMPESFILVCAVALLLGNGISIFLQGKGGKGVATTLGILVAINPLLIYYLLFVWFFVLCCTKKMGISCVAGLLALPFIAYVLMPLQVDLLLLMLFICFWGLWRHEKNIRQFFSWNRISA